MKRSVKSIVKASIVPVLLGVLLTGCLKKSDVSPTPVYSFVSVMNMASTAPSVEVYIDDVRETNPIPFGSYFPSYGMLEPGIKQVKFKKTASDSVVASIPALLYDSLEFSTLVLYDDPSAPGEADALRIRDDFSSLSISKVSLRFFNMSPSAGEVDFYLDGSKVSAGRTNADIALDTDLSDFEQYEQNTYVIKAKYINTDSVLVERGVTLNNGNAYTIVLKGDANSSDDDLDLSLEVIRAAN